VPPHTDLSSSIFLHLLAPIDCRAFSIESKYFTFGNNTDNTVALLNLFKYSAVSHYLLFLLLVFSPWASLAGTRAQSSDRYGSGTLHPGQVLRGSLPLLSPLFIGAIFFNKFKITIQSSSYRPTDKEVWHFELSKWNLCYIMTLTFLRIVGETLYYLVVLPVGSLKLWRHQGAVGFGLFSSYS
jgi:hypothetical protein